MSGAVRVVALAFPLHPPGHPERSRVAELRGAGAGVLVINGDRDPFGVPDEADAERLVVLPERIMISWKDPALDWGGGGALAGGAPVIPVEGCAVRRR